MKMSPSFSTRSTTTLFLLLLAQATAWAADQPGPDELIQQGLSLRREGKATEALVLFQRAHAMAPSPRTFGQTGLVEASLEHWVDADMHLSVALTTPDDPWIRKNRAFLEQALATSKQHVGELLVSGPTGVEVFVDGKSIGTLPAIPSLHLVVGEVRISASAPGFRPFDQAVTIRPSERASVAVSLSRIPLAPTPALPSATSATSIRTGPPESAHSSASIGRHKWIGASMAALGAGVLAWGVVWVKIDGRDDCGGVHGTACGTTYNTKTLGWALAGAGAATVVGGGIVFFTGHRSTGSTVVVGVTPSSVLLQMRF